MPPAAASAVRMVRPAGLFVSLNVDEGAPLKPPTPTPTPMVGTPVRPPTLMMAPVADRQPPSWRLHGREFRMGYSGKPDVARQAGRDALTSSNGRLEESSPRR